MTARRKSLFSSKHVFKMMKSVCEGDSRIKSEGIGKKAKDAYCITYSNGKYRVFKNDNEVVGYGTYDCFYEAFRTFIDLQTNDYPFAVKMEKRLKNKAAGTIRMASAFKGIRKASIIAKKRKE